MQVVEHEKLCTTEQREVLGAYLRHTHKRYVARAKCRCELESYTTLMAEVLLCDFAELVFTAIISNDWEKTFDWFDGIFTQAGDHALIKTILLTAITVLDEECEHMLPLYAPLLGGIRVRFALMRKILASDVHVSWRSLQEQHHDPVDVAVDGVLASLDIKDIATGEHSRAVSAWCTRIARKLGLSAAMTIRVTRGGLVHDIGKTTTPIDILTAARRLADDERQIMQNHVIAGWDMALEIPELAEFLSIIRNHHERYAGGGYPDGMAWRDTPLSTRIVTVADSFNAMIGRRPYRVPLSPMGAVTELRRHRSQQFDPDVTDAMSEIVYEMVEKNGITVPRSWSFVVPTGLVEE